MLLVVPSEYVAVAAAAVAAAKVAVAAGAVAAGILASVAVMVQVVLGLPSRLSQKDCALRCSPRAPLHSKGSPLHPMAAPLVLPASTFPGTACPEGEKIAHAVRHACTYGCGCCACNCCCCRCCCCGQYARGETAGCDCSGGGGGGAGCGCCCCFCRRCPIGRAGSSYGWVASGAAVVDADLAGVAAAGTAAATALPAVVAAATLTGADAAALAAAAVAADAAELVVGVLRARLKAFVQKIQSFQ